MSRILLRNVTFADSSQDHDYTDWDEVERWAREFATFA